MSLALAGSGQEQSANPEPCSACKQGGVQETLSVPQAAAEERCRWLETRDTAAQLVIVMMKQVHFPPHGGVDGRVASSRGGGALAEVVDPAQNALERRAVQPKQHHPLQAELAQTRTEYADLRLLHMSFVDATRAKLASLESMIDLRDKENATLREDLRSQVAFHPHQYRPFQANDEVMLLLHALCGACHYLRCLDSPQFLCRVHIMSKNQIRPFCF